MEHILSSKSEVRNNDKEHTEPFVKLNIICRNIIVTNKLHQAKYKCYLIESVVPEHAANIFIPRKLVVIQSALQHLLPNKAEGSTKKGIIGIVCFGSVTIIATSKSIEHLSMA